MLTQWTCPECGATARVPAGRQVQCYCQSDQRQLGKRGKARLAVCRRCVHFRGCRCTLIDLGCSRTYRAKLTDEGPAGCPLGLWDR